jgi:hypothetical protein
VPVGGGAAAGAAAAGGAGRDNYPARGCKGHSDTSGGCGQAALLFLAPVMNQVTVPHSWDKGFCAGSPCLANPCRCWTPAIGCQQRQVPVKVVSISRGRCRPLLAAV